MGFVDVGLVILIFVILVFMGFIFMGFVFVVLTFVVLNQLVFGEVQVAETAGGTNFGQVSHTSGAALPRWHHTNSTGLQGLLSILCLHLMITWQGSGIQPLHMLADYTHQRQKHGTSFLPVVDGCSGLSL